MEAAKKAVADFTSKRGHKTYVDENVRPAVTRETVKPTRHEIVTEAIDREVHQHHYHTTVQPISHREELPTKHTHNLLAVTKKNFEDRTRDHNIKIEAAHKHELGLFTNHTHTHPVAHSKASMPVAVGEHVHHHVHEIVIPVILKETHKPEIVHTTVPIHEVHHREPIHHQMSELKHMSMADFMSRHRAGGSASRETYNGPPRQYNSRLSINPTKYLHHTTAETRNSTTTPPLSPASAASSISMPSTPTGRGSVDADIRKSVDTDNNFRLSNSPTLGKAQPITQTNGQPHVYV